MTVTMLLNYKRISITEIWLFLFDDLAISEYAIPDEQILKLLGSFRCLDVSISTNVVSALNFYGEQEVEKLLLRAKKSKPSCCTVCVVFCCVLIT